MEGFKGSFLWNLTRRRSCVEYIYPPVGGRMPNFVCFGGKLPMILDVLSHQVSADVRGKVVEEEPLEDEALSLVDTMIKRKQATHFTDHEPYFVIIH